MANKETDLTLEIYEAFALNQLDRWDGLIRPDVKVNSPAGRDIVGIDALKAFGAAFHAAFRPRIDHFVAGHRALVTINLHWRHDGEEFLGSPRPVRVERPSSLSCFGLRMARSRTGTSLTTRSTSPTTYMTRAWICPGASHPQRWWQASRSDLA